MLKAGEQCGEMSERDQTTNLVPFDRSTGEGKVGYKNPPFHTRFKPGTSGNPSGRAKGSKNLRTLFQRVMKEEVSLRDGNSVKKVTKAEAVIRSVVIGALKGDSRSLGMLLRVAEATGEFEDKEAEDKLRTIVMVRSFHKGNPDEG
jgi:hypothetical protein